MSEFRSRAESSEGLTKLRAHLTEADELVWSTPYFPHKLRPDVADIGFKYRIGRPSIEQTDLTIHPLIPSPLRETLIEAKEQFDREFAENKIAAFEPESGSTIFHPLILVDDGIARRTVYHEAATSIVHRSKTTTSGDYSSWDEQSIREALEYLSVEEVIPFESTTIERMGFRKLLMADGFALADLLRPELSLLNEILPTGFEIITDQAIEFPGGIEALDRRIQQGRIALTRREDHPRFAAALFALSRSVDWRGILEVFIDGEAQELPNLFEEIFGSKGPESLGALMKTMSDDEQDIFDFNKLSSLRL